MIIWNVEMFKHCGGQSNWVIPIVYDCTAHRDPFHRNGFFIQKKERKRNLIFKKLFLNKHRLINIFILVVLLLHGGVWMNVHIYVFALVYCMPSVLNLIRWFHFMCAPLQFNEACHTIAFRIHLIMYRRLLLLFYMLCLFAMMPSIGTVRSFMEYTIMSCKTYDSLLFVGYAPIIYIF